MLMLAWLDYKNNLEHLMRKGGLEKWILTGHSEDKRKRENSK